MKNLKINCPNCRTDFNLDSALISQFQDIIKKDLQQELRERENELKVQKEEFNALSKKFERDKSELDELVNSKVKSLLKSRVDNLKDSIRNQIEDEKKKQLQELEDELKRKSSQLIELNQTRAKMQRLSREFEEREAKLHLKMEEKLSERLSKLKVSAKEEAQMEAFLKVKEKENIIESLQKKLQEAQQRVTQGSMQMQGEAQELAIEQILSETHPNDEIEEIKKGARGADCIQRVIIPGKGVVGSILYESKNTKNWSDSFVSKLKDDNLNQKAELLVIVTKTLPKEAKGKFLLINGVWITTLQNVKDLSLLLRFGLLKTHSVMLTQSGKEDKMSLLYDYLTSDEFRATFESILKGFTSLQESHNEEQRKMILLWKKRETYLKQVLSSTINFYGSIKGISEESIPTIEMLEIKKAI